MSSPNPAAPPTSPILRIRRGESERSKQQPAHSHPEPILLSSSTATVMGSMASRDWVIPPGYGLWIPGGVEHGGTVLRDGELSIIHFAADRCPITWTEPTGVEVGPLLLELIRHLRQIGPDEPSRPLTEALMFELLVPLVPHDIQVSMPTDPRIRAIAERILVDPADQRELAAWADHVHAGVRTLSRLFQAETGLTFAAWRTQVRIRTAVLLLDRGTPVNATARAVGYGRPSAFISAFRRITGRTPGAYGNGR